MSQPTDPPENCHKNICGMSHPLIHSGTSAMFCLFIFFPGRLNEINNRFSIIRRWYENWIRYKFPDCFLFCFFLLFFFKWNFCRHFERQKYSGEMLRACRPAPKFFYLIEPPFPLPLQTVTVFLIIEIPIKKTKILFVIQCSFSVAFPSPSTFFFLAT